MICKYPPDSRMHNACILCNERDLCGGIHTMLYDYKPLNTIPMSEVKQPRDDFLDAEEAYKATYETIDKYNTPEILELENKILEAIDAGEFGVCIKGDISEIARRYFANKNYKIIDGYGKNGFDLIHYTNINWNFT